MAEVLQTASYLYVFLAVFKLVAYIALIAFMWIGFKIVSRRG